MVSNRHCTEINRIEGWGFWKCPPFRYVVGIPLYSHLET
jgi:hypothetical protein